MKRSLSLLLTACVAALALDGCVVPAVRFSPRNDAVILLPKDSTASVTGHFHRWEDKNYYPGLVRGITYTEPLDFLARTEPNVPLKNVKIDVHLDPLRELLVAALSVATWVGVDIGTYLALGGPSSTSSTAINEIGVIAGFLGYALVWAFVPESLHVDIRGETTSPPANLGKGQAHREALKQSKSE